MRQTLRQLTSQEMSRNQSIHDALKAELVAELKQTGTLGHKGRIITTSAPRLKARLVRS
ncbi:hypothetical protein UM677_001823 [Cronobacter sakazakii]|nr:hypothetical protein [Cronobacter sakazakii]